jgi:hypothetical protein
MRDKTCAICGRPSGYNIYCAKCKPHRKKKDIHKKSYRVFYPDCALPDEYTRTDFDAHKKTLRLMGARWERI